MQTDFLIMQNSQEMLSEKSIKCEEGNQKAVKPSEVAEGEDLSFFSAFIEIADSRNMPLLTKQDMLELIQTGVLKDGIEAGISDKLPVKDESINPGVKILSDCPGLNFAWIQTDDNEASGFEPDGNSKISDQAIEITAIIEKNDELIKADNPLQIVEEIKGKDLKLESRAANSDAIPDKNLKL
ncbi:MAG: hypothetical protein U9Q38_07480, partial [Thermodesulfobacteriota bacterium]|nr:hypothetical protein [Thermodesulfobacteriota bacterium]